MIVNGISSIRWNRSLRKKTPSTIVRTGEKRQINEANDGSSLARPAQPRIIPAPVAIPRIITLKVVCLEILVIATPDKLRIIKEYNAALPVQIRLKVSGLNAERAYFAVMKLVETRKVPPRAKRNPFLISAAP